MAQSKVTPAIRRRRLSLLATSSFVASSILNGGGVLTVVMTPSVAMASGASLAQSAVSIGLG